jgi:hypothetical protein
VDWFLAFDRFTASGRSMSSARASLQDVGGSRRYAHLGLGQDRARPIDPLLSPKVQIFAWPWGRDDSGHYLGLEE